MLKFNLINPQNKNLNFVNKKLVLLNINNPDFKSGDVLEKINLLRQPISMQSLTELKTTISHLYKEEEGLHVILDNLSFKNILPLLFIANTCSQKRDDVKRQECSIYLTSVILLYYNSSPLALFRQSIMSQIKVFSLEAYLDKLFKDVSTCTVQDITSQVEDSLKFIDNLLKPMDSRESKIAATYGRKYIYTAIKERDNNCKYSSKHVYLSSVKSDIHPILYHYNFEDDSFIPFIVNYSDDTGVLQIHSIASIEKYQLLSLIKRFIPGEVVQCTMDNVIIYKPAIQGVKAVHHINRLLGAIELWSDEHCISPLEFDVESSQYV